MPRIALVALAARRRLVRLLALQGVAGVAFLAAGVYVVAGLGPTLITVGAALLVGALIA